MSNINDDNKNTKVLTVLEFAHKYDLNTEYVRRLCRLEKLDTRKDEVSNAWFIYDCNHPFMVPEGYIPLTEYAGLNNKNEISLRKSCNEGLLNALKVGRFWYVNPDTINHFGPEGYIPLEEFAALKKISVTYTRALCREQAIDCVKVGKYWFVKKDFLLPKEKKKEVFKIEHSRVPNKSSLFAERITKYLLLNAVSLQCEIAGVSVDLTYKMVTFNLVSNESEKLRIKKLSYSIYDLDLKLQEEIREGFNVEAEKYGISYSVLKTLFDSVQFVL